MTALNAAARELVRSGALAHLVTVGADGAPQVSVVWMDVDDDGTELRAAHLSGTQRKLRNVQANPRVAVTFEAPTANDVGMRHYLVVYGEATVTEGGAPELLHELAQTYVGPGTVFPPFPDPPPGFITHIRPTSISGVGPWKD